VSVLDDGFPPPSGGRRHACDAVATGPRTLRESVQRRTHEDTISADHRLTPRFRITPRVAAPANAREARPAAVPAGPGATRQPRSRLYVILSADPVHAIGGHMKRRIRAIAFAAVALALPGAAFALTDGSAQYDDCMLNALRESRNGAAAQLIQRSCDALYRNNAMLLPRERRFHECVVQSLPGVRDNYAIQQIMSICSRRGEM